LRRHHRIRRRSPPRPRADLVAGRAGRLLLRPPRDLCDLAAQLRTLPPEKRALFLEGFAARIEARRAELVELAHAETGLPRSPRLADVELPRTTGQLRQGAAAVLEGSWAFPTIDTKLNIRSLRRSVRSEGSAPTTSRSLSTAPPAATSWRR